MHRIINFLFAVLRALATLVLMLAAGQSFASWWRKHPGSPPTEWDSYCPSVRAKSDDGFNAPG